MEFISHSAKETKKLGELLGKELKQGLIIALEGDLGSGKTTFVQGLAKGLGIRKQIISPTFVIMRQYRLTKRDGLKNFCHIDFYRIHSGRDLANLGFEKIINDLENIVAIEWPERVKDIALANKLLIKFKHINMAKRKLIFNNN